jgi:hypothetical protein
MPCDNVRKFLVDVFSPLNVVAIGRVCQPWEESEFEMVVRINQTRHDQKLAEVDIRALRLAKGRVGVLLNISDAARSYLDRNMVAVLRIVSIVSSMNYYPSSRSGFGALAAHTEPFSVT